ncbi:MAG: preprotein translocase subunit SecA [Minisyncoccia bacterium]
MSFISKIFGDANLRAVRQLEDQVAAINELEPKFELFSREELKNKTDEFKKRLSDGSPPHSNMSGGGETLDDILPEAFAAVREASKRTLGQRHFDVQLIGGMVLHAGNISEMKTGEGKTLVATLPAYLNALTGLGVHLVTVNDYLSRRDAVWMGQIYDALGLTIGVLNHEASYLYDPSHGRNHESGIMNQEEKDHNSEFVIHNSKTGEKEDALDKTRDITGGFRVIHEFLRPVTRREAYLADITYGTNNEYGFDYLRDNMAYNSLEKSQAKGHNFAIVDEIDSILIDEARTPLIISAPDMESTQLYETFSKITPRLTKEEDYTVDEKLKAVSITEKGIEKVERMLNVKNIYEEGGTRYVHQLEQALKANILFHRDKDYVVKNGEVIIVDEFTGRLMPGRRWSGGLHQAVEAKENVLVQKESKTLATITFQNYFRLYGKLAGMTGTAQTSAEEFHKVYKLEVISVPTNKPMIRADEADRIYKTEEGKMKAVAREVKERHDSGQPVLVGTTSISKNEILSAYLNNEGVPHKVLNAKNHEQEGEIIAQAGHVGAVTVATNMAGRGVDIILGGNPPSADEAKKVIETGGLHVIGTERHEARRIDNQLRGRSGRQGDPGSSQFFVSAEDELIRIFGGDRLKNLMERLGVGEDDAIENRLISRAIEQAQTKVEGNNFDIRKYVLEYDDVMNKHRTAIYGLRNEILGSKDVKEKIVGYIDDNIDKIVNSHFDLPSEGIDERNHAKEIAEDFKMMIPVDDGGMGKIIEVAKTDDREKIREFLTQIADLTYAEKEKQLGEEGMRNLERMLMLRVIDEIWVDHLEQMEYLRDSVRLRAYGQRDPLVEYKIEGQKLFNELQSAIGNQVANIIYKIGPVQQPVRKVAMDERKPDIANQESGVMNRANQNQNQTVISSGQKEPGRNDPCPCGSGRKWKKCGLINAPYHRK